MIDRLPGRATLVRDAHGVPHIFSTSRRDAYFGLGYALAEDWLPEMMARYAWAIGEASRLPSKRFEELGLRDAALSDFHVSLWNHAAEARIGFDRLEKVWQDVLTAFVGGIESYVAERPEVRLDWAPPLQPWLPLALSRAFAWFFASYSALAVLKQHGVKAASGASVLDILDMDLLGSSNAWVVMPARTCDGSLIHVTDSHAQFHGVGRMTAFRMNCADLKVSGTTVIGLPWLLKGNSPFAAWGWTDGGNRVSDCYSLRLGPHDGSTGEKPGRTIPAAAHGAALESAALPDNEVRYAILNGIRSPIVAEVDGLAYAICTPYMHRAGATDALMFRLQEACDRKAVLDVLGDLDLLPTNLIIGTADGMALFAKPGRIPVRSPPYDGTSVVPAESADGCWAGFHPFESQVSVIDPPAGFVQNCNNSADVMFEAGNIDAADYPTEVFADAPGLDHWRCKRLRQLIGESSEHDLESTLEILHDELWPDVPLWQHRIARLRLAAREMEIRIGAAAEALLDAIARFDGRAARESREALLFYLAMNAFAEEEGLLQCMTADGPQGAQGVKSFVAALGLAVARLAGLDAGAAATLGSLFVARAGGQLVPVGGVMFRAGEVHFTTLRNMFCRPGGQGGRSELVYGQRQPQVTIFGAGVVGHWRLLSGRRDGAGVSLNESGVLATGARILYPALLDEHDLIGEAQSVSQIPTFT